MIWTTVRLNTFSHTYHWKISWLQNKFLSDGRYWFRKYWLKSSNQSVLGAEKFSTNGVILRDIRIMTITDLKLSAYSKLEYKSLPQILVKFPNIKCITFSDSLEINVQFLLSTESVYDKLECLHLNQINFLDETESLEGRSFNKGYGFRFGFGHSYISNRVRTRWTQFVQIVGPKLLDLTINCDLNKDMIKQLIQNWPKLQELVLYGRIADDIFEGLSNIIRTIELVEGPISLNQYYIPAVIDSKLDREFG